MATAATEVPKHHKAALYSEPGKNKISFEDIDTPEPGSNEVLIKLTHSGVCRSDYGIMTNGWALLPHPTQKNQVGGHEGIGTIVKMGPNTDKSGRKVGDRVGIKWVSDICHTCSQCRAGMDGVCANGKVSGYYTPGTFQQYALGPADYVTPIPEGLDSAMAAPMLCAGITAYAALRKSQARAGQWVAVLGATGGVGHLATQISTNGMAFRTIGVDIGAKKDFAVKNGCEDYVDAAEAGKGEGGDKAVGDAVKKIADGVGVHAVVCCTASNKAYAQAMGMLRPGGTLVCVGLPEGKPEPIAGALPMAMVFQMFNIVGSAVGNQVDAAEILDMAARGKVKTDFRVEPMGKLSEIFDEMEENRLKGRVVLDLTK